MHYIFTVYVRMDLMDIQSAKCKVSFAKKNLFRITKAKVMLLLKP